MCRGGQQVDILVPHHHQAQYAADKMSLSPLLVLMRFMTWETLRLLFSEIEFRERRRIAEAKSAGGKKGKKGKKKKVWGEVSSEEEEAPTYSNDEHSSEDEDDDLILVKECMEDMVQVVEVADTIDYLITQVEVAARMRKKNATFRAKRGRKKTKKVSASYFPRGKYGLPSNMMALITSGWDFNQGTRLLKNAMMMSTDVDQSKMPKHSLK